MGIFGIKTKQDRQIEQLQEQLGQQKSLISNLAQENFLTRAPGDPLVDLSPWVGSDVGFPLGGHEGRYYATSEDVYSCVRLRSDALASVKVKLYQSVRVAGKQEKKEIPDHPVLTLLTKVNPRWTFRRLLYFTEQSLCLYGRNYWLLEKPFRGMPTEIWWLHPAQVAPVTVNDGRDLIGYIYTDEKGTKKSYKPEQIIPFDYPYIENQWRGMSPVDVLRLGLDTRRAMDRYNKAFFENSGAPGVALESDKSVSPQDAASIIRSFEKITRGVDKAHSTVILADGLKAKLLAMPHKDMEFLQGQQVSLHRVGRVYGISPTLLGDLMHATLANVAEYEQSFWSRTMLPALQAYQDVLDEYLLPFFFPAEHVGEYCLEFDTSDIKVLQEDEKKQEEVELIRWQKYQIQVVSGIVKKNEVREKEGMKPLPELDQPVLDPSQAQVAQPPQLDKPKQQPVAALPAPADNQTQAKGYAAPVANHFHLTLNGTAFDKRPTVKLSENGHVLVAQAAPVKISQSTNQAQQTTIELVPDPTAVYWYAFVEKGAPVEDDFIRAFKGWLQPIENEVVDALRANKSLSSWAKSSDLERYEITRGLMDDLKQALNPERLIKNALNRFAGAVERGVQAGVSLASEVLGEGAKEVTADTVKEVAFKLAKEMAGHITKTTVNDLTELVKQGVNDGKVIAEIIREVKEKFAGWKEGRASMIAVTETTRASNAGVVTTLETSEVKTKMWVTQLDGRVRDAHKDAHGQVVDVGEKFSVGGYKMRYPGDEDAPADLTVRCRCVVAPGNG
jgi:HK97 family phage portal protein